MQGFLVLGALVPEEKQGNAVILALEVKCQNG